MGSSELASNTVVFSRRAGFCLSAALLFLAACGGSPEQPAETPPPAGPSAGPPRPLGGKSAALEAAKKRAREGDVKGAIEAAKQAVRETPSSEEPYVLLSSLYGVEGDVAAAEKVIDEGLAAVPRSALLHHAKGLAALEQSRLEVAVSELEQARDLIGKGEERAEILADLAYAYVFVNKLTEAESLAAESRSLDPKSYAAAFTHGEALLRLEKFPEAADAYREAMKLSPEESVTKSRLATALLKSEDYAGAIPLLEEMLAVEKQDPARLHAALAQAKLKTGDAAAAVEHAKTAVKLAPAEKPYKDLLAEAQKAAKKRGKKGK